MRVLRVARTPLSFPQHQPDANSVVDQSPSCGSLQLQELAYCVWGREGVLGGETGLKWAFSRHGPFLPVSGNSKSKL